MRTLDLSSEVIVVSGAAGGLGRFICRGLAGLGARVVAVDIAEWPDELSAMVAGEIWPYRADVAVVDEVAALLRAVEDRFRRAPSTICCHAGIVEAHSILDYPVAALDDLFRANVRTAFALAQAGARRWRELRSTGHLIFTSSWVQDYPWPEIAPYCASKAAVHSLMRSFAKELAPFGIRANAVLPGIVSAGMAKRQWEKDENYRRRAEQAIALGYLQDPESVVDAFVFLCSPMASYMTGSALVVDGGCSLLGPV